jgi:hypothetical protein
MKNTLTFLASMFFALLILLTATCQAQAAKASYPTMAPLDQYLIPDMNSEIALARSAAPPSISDAAEVMVLGPQGYTSAVKGTNGFLCIVERSWGAATDEPEFWNPKVRSHLLQSSGRNHLRTHLSHEDQIGVGRKIQSRNRRGDRVGSG